MMLLHHRYLAVKSEQHLFYTVCNYVEVNFVADARERELCIHTYRQVHHEALTEEQIHSLMTTIRFRWLSYEQLEEVHPIQVTVRRSIRLI